jgi:hypothetical protein
LIADAVDEVFVESFFFADAVPPLFFTNVAAPAFFFFFAATIFDGSAVFLFVSSIMDNALLT